MRSPIWIARCRLDADIDETGGKPAQELLMFEMKSASFTVNDRTLLHPTDLRFEQGQV